MKYKVLLTGRSLNRNKLIVRKKDESSQEARIHRRFLGSLLFNYSEIKFEYYTINPKKLALLRMAIKRHIEYCRNHADLGFEESFFHYVAKIKIDPEVDFPVRLSIAGSSKELWIARTAITKGVYPNTLNANIEYERFRKPHHFSGFVWKIKPVRKISKLHKNKKVIKQFQSFSLNTFYSVFEIEKKLTFSSHANASVIHGSLVLTEKNRVHPISNFGEIEPSSWPTDVIILSEDKYYYFNTYKNLFSHLSIFFGTSDNWFHFISEILPRFLHYGEMELINKQIILNSNVPKQIINICADLTNIRPMLIGPCERLIVENLITCSDFRFVNRLDSIARKSDLIRVREYLLRKYAREAKQPYRRIYIVREQKLFRKLENQLDLIALLKNYDFEFVDPGKMNVAEQIELFSNSEIIIGEAGAALTNVMFCNISAKVIEIHPHYGYDGFWNKYCSNFVESYYTILGERVGHFNGIARTDSYNVDLQEVRHILDSLLGIKI